MCRNLNLGAVEIEIDAKIVFGWIIEEYSIIYIMFLLSWIVGPSSIRFFK